MPYLLGVCLAALTTIATGGMLSAGAESQGAAPMDMQEGISVELPVASNAVAIPEADQNDAFVITVTRDGSIYVRATAITLRRLAGRIKADLSGQPSRCVYIKADASTPYGNVVKILDEVRTAGVKAPVLLTEQRESSPPGARVPPKGLSFGQCD